VAAARTLTVIHNDITLIASAADTTATGVSIGTKYGVALLVKITNGATGPTVPAQCRVQVSGDDSNYYNYGGALVAGTANYAAGPPVVGVYSWDVPLPLDAQALYVRTVSGSNTGQNVTLRVELATVDSI